MLGILTWCHHVPQAVQERLDAVEAAVADLAPAVEEIFAKHRDQTAVDSATARIRAAPHLNDYYVLFQMKARGTHVGGGRDPPAPL